MSTNGYQEMMMMINLNHFMQNKKMLCHSGFFETNSAPAAADTWDLQGQILRSGRM